MEPEGLLRKCSGQLLSLAGTQQLVFIPRKSRGILTQMLWYLRVSRKEKLGKDN